jgi:hypothetical protein
MPDMTLSPPPRVEVYLVENRLSPISTRAALELTNEYLRCTVKEYSKWVEKAWGFQISGLGFKRASRLRCPAPPESLEARIILLGNEFHYSAVPVSHGYFVTVT